VFTEADVEAIRAEFIPWLDRQAAKAAQKPTTARSTRARAHVSRADRDALVWAEEVPVVLEDIRRPSVRARVRAEAQAAEDRLNALLLASGLHVSQARDRATA
jgi:uncharacterized iron-regulated membrane protein